MTINADDVFGGVTAGGGFTTRVAYTTSGTFTVPDGIYSIFVMLTGGGGGGGGGAWNSLGNHSGGGGAAGAGTVRAIIPTYPGQTLAYVIGAGGAGGAKAASDGYPGNNGSSGGYSYLEESTTGDFELLYAKGGSGGASGYFTEAARNGGNAFLDNISFMGSQSMIIGGDGGDSGHTGGASAIQPLATKGPGTARALYAPTNGGAPQYTPLSRSTGTTCTVESGVTISSSGGGGGGGSFYGAGGNGKRTSASTSPAAAAYGAGGAGGSSSNTSGGANPGMAGISGIMEVWY